MNNTEKMWLCIAALVAMSGLVAGVISYNFSSSVVSTGNAYGFQIGDSREMTFQKSQSLLQHKQIAAIHTWPENEFHRPFTTGENPEKIMIVGGS